MRDAWKFIVTRRILKYAVFAVSALLLIRIVFLAMNYNGETDRSVHLKQVSNSITTTRITNDLATVLIKTTVENESDKKQTVVVRVDITDGYYIEKTISIAPKTEREVELITDIYQPKLWRADDPNLYEAKISVVKKKKVRDTLVESFSIKKEEPEPTL